jgi:hypothetical protein
MLILVDSLQCKNAENGRCLGKFPWVKTQNYHENVGPAKGSSIHYRCPPQALGRAIRARSSTNPGCNTLRLGVLYSFVLYTTATSPGQKHLCWHNIKYIFTINVSYEIYCLTATFLHEASEMGMGLVSWECGWLTFSSNVMLLLLCEPTLWWKHLSNPSAFLKCKCT